MSNAEEKTTRSILEDHDIVSERLERDLLNYWIKKCRKDTKRYTNQTLQELKEKVEDRISVIRDSIHEVEDKMNRYTFSAKEKREGSTYYGALQERETRYKRQIKELQTVITLIDEAMS